MVFAFDKYVHTYARTYVQYLLSTEYEKPTYV